MSREWLSLIKEELRSRGLSAVEAPDIFRSTSTLPAVRAVWINPEAKTGSLVPHIGFAVPGYDQPSFALIREFLAPGQRPPTIMPLQRICAWRRYLREGARLKPGEIADLIEEDLQALSPELSLQSYVDLATSGTEFSWSTLGVLWLIANVLRINTVIFGDPGAEKLPPAMLDALFVQHGRIRPAAYFVERIVAELNGAVQKH